jgi:protein-S-isoprenylcysteine O-methyltransferase Ste14
MLGSVSKFLSVQSGRRRPLVFRLCSLLAGTAFFLIVVPAALGAVGFLVARLVPLTLPRTVEIVGGICAAVLGLAVLLWAVTAFWRLGGGTPAPNAAPQKLVVLGPYRHCRNPIQLGANLYYLGIGCLALSFVAGATMFVIGLTLGSLYHRFIEEPELMIRFGTAYGEYRDRTPFLWPRFWRKHHFVCI